MSQNQTENRLIVKYRTLEETYVFSDGTDFTKTGGTYAAGDVTWSATFTSWKVTEKPLRNSIVLVFFENSLVCCLSDQLSTFLKAT